MLLWPLIGRLETPKYQMELFELFEKKNCADNCIWIEMEGGRCVGMYVEGMKRSLRNQRITTLCL